MRRAAFPVGVVLAALTWQQAGATVQKGVTAGQVVLLANTATSQNSRDRIKQAITDPDPLVRAAAARVAGTVHITEVGAEIADALGRESDQVAAIEQMRALLFLDGATAGPVVEKHLSRGGSLAVLLLAEWLARAQPERFADGLPILLRKQKDRSRDLAAVVRMATVQHPSLSERLSRAWRDAAPGEWGDYLERFEQEGRTISEAILLESLTSPNPDVRRYTVWRVIRDVARQTTVASAIVDTLVQPIAANGSADKWEAFGRQLVARRYRKTTSVDHSDVITSDGRNHLDDLEVLPGLTELTSKEQDAARTLLEAAGLGTAGVRPIQPAPASPPVVGARLASVPWPGLLDSVMTAAGCKPSNLGFAAARIEYAANGVPQKLVIDRRRQSSACEAAMIAIARISVADADRPIVSGESEWLMFPFDADSTHCIDMPKSEYRRLGAQRDGTETVKVPKKIRDVRPVYSESAIRNRITGIVFIEAIVTTTGCVTSARVTHSVATSLDLAALEAASGWQWEPAKQNNRPISTLITLSIMFTLTER